MAQSATGTGLGSSNKMGTKELAILANSLNIVMAGRVELAEDLMVNPPSPTATVTLGEALPGSNTNYAILVTGLSTGSVYVASMSNNGAGNFSQFRVIGESEGTCMYVIVKTGFKPSV